MSLSFFNCVRQYPFLGMIMLKLCFDWWTRFTQTRDTVFDKENLVKHLRATVRKYRATRGKS